MPRKRATYTAEFKLSAVKMTLEQKLSVAEVARRLGVGENRLHTRKKAVLADGAKAVPGSGHLTPLEEENRKLRAEVTRLEAGRDILTTATASLDPGGDPFAWIEERRNEWAVAHMCRVLGVSGSGYSAWRKRPPSAAEGRREGRTEGVKEIRAEVKGRYGSPHAHAELVARGHGCGVNFIAKLMREARTAVKAKRTFKQATDPSHALAVAENVSDRQLDPEELNARGCADITYLPTREYWPYLAVVEDLFRRMVVGWSMPATMTSRLVVDAREMALARRLSLQGSSPSALVAHSDRGSPYANEHDRRRLADERITCGMSRRGDCWDNAPVGSFFASVKKERVHDEDDATRDEARASLFEYIEALDNGRAQGQAEQVAE